MKEIILVFEKWYYSDIYTDEVLIKYNKSYKKLESFEKDKEWFYPIVIDDTATIYFKDYFEIKEVF